MGQGLRNALLSFVALIMFNGELTAQEHLFVDVTVNYRHYGTTLLLRDEEGNYYASISDLTK